MSFKHISIKNSNQIKLYIYIYYKQIVYFTIKIRNNNFD